MKVDKKFFDNLIKEWGPKAQKFGDDALKVVKKGANAVQINAVIKKNEAAILLAEQKIGKEIFDSKISVDNEKIKAELTKIKKYLEEIDKNKRALKALDEVKKTGSKPSSVKPKTTKKVAKKSKKK